MGPPHALLFPCMPECLRYLVALGGACGCPMFGGVWVSCVGWGVRVSCAIDRLPGLHVQAACEEQATPNRKNTVLNLMGDVPNMIVPF